MPIFVKVDYRNKLQPIIWIDDFEVDNSKEERLVCA